MALTLAQEIARALRRPQTFVEQLANTDPLSLLAAAGQVFYVSDADQNDMVTGQTSFANTTPTFLLDVPRGTTAIPLFLGLNQAGTVAGADIAIITELDDVVRYASGGTAETIFNSRSHQRSTAESTFYSNPTAAAGYGVRTFGVQLAPDISPAEGAIYEVVWTPGGSLDFIDGPGAWNVFTYAGTTGPTWLWSAKWAEVPTAWLATVREYLGL